MGKIYIGNDKISGVKIVSPPVNTADATITAEDVLASKIAYGPNGKVVGTFVPASATEPYTEEIYDSDGNLVNVKMYGGYETIRAYLFYNCTNLALISLPSGITSIGERAFYYCRNLALTSLPSGITSIGDQAFDSCRNLALTSLPSGITSIGDYAFDLCTSLTSLTFEGTPTSIASYAFRGCTNLTVINVPWAEGAVANAPWGATNATINYGYTG